MSKITEELYYIYTFENRCVEELDLVLPDEADHIKKKEEWRAEYMTMMELERQRYREGMERGMERAKERYREGLEQGIRYSYKQALKYGADTETAIEDIMTEYDMTEEQVKAILDREES